jgi:hypothetical protein
MTINERTTLTEVTTPAEIELDLQEALAQRHRAAELFGEPDWQEPADELDEDD